MPFPDSVKSVILLPYCPWPADTGAKVEMWKHLDLLLSMGECRVVSAAGKPVGAGWTEAALRHFRERGFEVKLRERDIRMTPMQALGIVYACAAKGLGRKTAFGFDNPYHRHAFPAGWWLRQTRDRDLAVLNYSYWAHLPCACPKAVVLHDLQATVMGGDPGREADTLRPADLVVVISRREESMLRERGLTRLLWSPPAVDAEPMPDSGEIGLVATASEYNLEGLRWLAPDGTLPLRIHLYGNIPQDLSNAFQPHGAYKDHLMPYRACGIILMTTALGSGVQIKAVEALACGRAVIARPGAMRGLPPGEGAWIEAETPADMLREAGRLQNSPEARRQQMEAARAYFRRHLDAAQVREHLRKAYDEISR